MFRNLIWLSIGAFAVGTEGFVIAGILPALARDLQVSLAVAGQLVTVFSLVYALGSPLLAIATAHWPREYILRASMAGFALANLLAALAPSYGWLMAVRVLLALTAGLFMPTAGAYAAASVEPAQRGRALGIVYVGMTTALVVGVPLGTLLGGHLGWRAPFAGVAILALLALVGLCLPRKRQPMQAPASLSERLAVAKRPEILRCLGVTFFMLAGAFAVYTYLAPLLHAATGMSEQAVGWVLMVFGIGAATGNMIGGHLADRKGAGYVIRRVLTGMTFVFAGVSIVATWAAPPLSTVLLLALIATWGLVGWSFPPAQQSYLVHLAPTLTPVVLSLNSSAMYLGASMGALASSTVVALGHVTAIGWVAAICEVIGLGLVLISGYKDTTQPLPPAASADAAAAVMH